MFPLGKQERPHLAIYVNDSVEIGTGFAKNVVQTLWAKFIIERIGAEMPQPRRPIRLVQNLNLSPKVTNFLVVVYLDASFQGLRSGTFEAHGAIAAVHKLSIGK
jgi:hypothetical protein